MKKVLIVPVFLAMALGLATTAQAGVMVPDTAVAPSPVWSAYAATAYDYPDHAQRCVGQSSGTAHHACGSITGGPSGGSTHH